MHQEISKKLSCPLSFEDVAKLNLKILANSEKIRNVIEDIRDCEMLLRAITEESYRIQRDIANGAQVKTVLCQVVFYEPKNYQKTIYRTDTGEKVSIESMSDDELQEEMRDIMKESYNFNKKNELH